MKTRLYMVRHADSPFVFGQEQARGLSEEGKEAAMKVADVLDPFEIHCVCSSNYARAIQTVQEVADRRKLPVVEYDELRERPIKGLDYRAPWEELLVAIEKSFTDLEYALQGGESTREAQDRAIPVIKKLLAENKGNNIVLGTHGNIMTIIMNYYDKRYGYEFWMSTSKPDIYELRFNENGLEEVNRLWRYVE
ncbi:histidine phosphatase family protein [Cohnella sp. GCM10027633]|uniref:histidine phosphatase family protein n=1 Tax=unclassified Cohnella TaxID=2636738 RepID=UPI003636A1F5